MRRKVRGVIQKLSRSGETPLLRNILSRTMGANKGAGEGHRKKGQPQPEEGSSGREKLLWPKFGRKFSFNFSVGKPLNQRGSCTTKRGSSEKNMPTRDGGI